MKFVMFQIMGRNKGMKSKGVESENLSMQFFINILMILKIRITFNRILSVCHLHQIFTEIIFTYNYETFCVQTGRRIPFPT